MAHLLTVDLDTLTPGQAELLAGFIMTFADGRKSQFTEDVQTLTPAPPAIDPAAAFGSIPQGKISEVAPSVEIPAAAPAPPAPASAGVTLDKDGLPWDQRIHSSSKGMNADGTWRLKRGLAKDHLEKVTAELKQVMSIPSPGPQLVPPPPAPAPQAAAAPPPPPPANVADLRDQYIALFGRVSAAISNGKITQAQLDKCLASVGVPSIPLLGARPDLVPQACALIDGVIAGASA